VRREVEKSLPLADKSSLIDKLIEGGYAFAVWRMPDSAKLNFIIAFQEARQTDLPIHELDQGFILNTYSANHPKKPYFIPADAIFKADDLIIDPRISASQISKFFASLDRKPYKRSAYSSSAFPTPSQPANKFESKVNQALISIENGEFEKVVLSRYEEVVLEEDFSIWDFFQQISQSYPTAFCSISHLPGKGLWIGASPELLISDNGDLFKTIALAGTKSLEEDQELKEIAWTHKEIEEQALVSRYIINCFKKLRLREFEEHGPKTVKSGHLAHLKTGFEVKYAGLGFEGLSDQMLGLLHPTSAVCGMPIEKTKPFIDAVEEYDREFYAGFLGPVNFNNSINLFVNLRCMKVEDDTARLFAGAGITEDSVPSKEFQETELKLKVMKRFLETK